MIDLFGLAPAAAPPDPGTHLCPGLCGRAIYRHRITCATCWHRLPVPLRRGITTTRIQGDAWPRTAAIAAALEWYSAQDRQAFAVEVRGERALDAAGLEH